MSDVPTGPNILQWSSRTPDKMCVPDRDLFHRFLKTAADFADKENCAVERWIDGGRFLSEADLYSCLAHYLEADFIAEPVQIDTTVDPYDALAAGLAPIDLNQSNPSLEPNRFIYAPQGERLAWFAYDLPDDLLLTRAGLAITTPRMFQASIRGSFGPRITQDAIGQIRKRHRRASAASLGSTVWIALLMSWIGIVFSSILITKTGWHSLLLLLTCFPILPGLVLKILAFKQRSYGDIAAPIPDDCDLPTYSVLVPIYREAAIIPELIQSLLALDYPVAKLDIKLLLEADDEETRAELQKIRLPPSFDIIIIPPGSPRTKPRALAVGLAYTTSEFIVVYDAEDHPDSDQLKKAAAIFISADQNLACLQARLTIDNVDDSWLTQQFAMEYAGLFDVILPGLAALAAPIPLGGTSNHFRRSALEKLGGWDSWNVTEDADLGLRLYRAGYRVCTFQSTTHEEAPANWKAWRHQRIRWLKGWMQTALVHMRSHGAVGDRLSPSRWFILCLTACLSPICILLHPALLLSIDLLIDMTRPAPTEIDTVIRIGFAILYLGSLTLDMMIAKAGARARHLEAGSGALLGLAPYSLLKTIAGWRALVELIHAPYHWRKTRHGLAQTSRRKRPSNIKTAF